jgi:predicted MFS family arabinose efflux permease
LISGGILFIVLGQLESFAAILACSFVLALLNDMFRPANATAVAHYSKEENITRSFSLNRLSINLGWAVGGAIGGFIASHNYHLLFWIDGCTNIGAALLLRAVLSPSKNNLTPPNKDFRAKTTTHSAYKDGPYLLFIAMTVLFGIMFFQIFSTLPVFFTQVLHLTPFYVGLVMSVNGLLIALFEMAIVYKLGQKNDTIRFIGIGVILIGISYIVFNFLPGQLSLAMLSTVIVTFGEMLSMPFMNTYWVSRTNKDNRGQYAGLYTVAWSVAQVVGPYFGSQLAEHTGFTALWWVMGVISLIAAFGFISLSGKRRK